MSGKAEPGSLPPWGAAVAGASGAIFANAIAYPLDIVKTRIQVQVQPRISGANAGTDIHYKSTLDAIQKVLDDEGIGGLYAGITSSMFGVASTNFAYFYWYSVVRSLHLSLRKVEGPPNTATELSLGALAGALAQIFTIPVSVITTRQQTESKISRKGLFETGREVVEGEDGWTGLWRGLKASLVLVVNPAITYGAYQRLRWLLFAQKSNLRPWESFVLGASAKALATVVTQPLIVAKVGLQSRPPQARQGRPFKSFVEVLRYIIEQEGLPSLFKGLGPQIMKGILVQGLLMMIKDRVEILFALLFAHVRRLREEKLKRAIDKAASRAKDALPSSPLISRTVGSATTILK